MFRQTIAVLTLAAFLFSPLKGLSAEQVEHLIPAADLQLQLAAAEFQRQSNVRDVERILDREDAQQLLAEQSRNVNEDVSGGFVGGIIILLILALVLAVILVRNNIVD